MDIESMDMVSAPEELAAAPSSPAPLKMYEVSLKKVFLLEDIRYLPGLRHFVDEDILQKMQKEDAIDKVMTFDVGE